MAELMICGDGEVRHDGATVGHIQWAAPFADFGVAGVYDNYSDFGGDCWTEQDDIDDLKGDLEREEAARERGKPAERRGRGNRKAQGRGGPAES